MSLSIRRLTVLASALVAVLAMTATAAFAQYPPPEGLALACDRDGDQVGCAVANAQPNERLTARASYNPTFYEESFNADANGEATFSFVVPAEAEDRPITVTVEGELSGSAGDAVAPETDGTAPGTAAPGTPVSGTTDTLPFTGTEVGMLLALALGLIGTGLVALRRREDRKVSI